MGIRRAFPCTRRFVTRDLVAGREPDDAALKLADARPGSLEIEEEPDVLADPLRGGADAPDGAAHGRA